MASLFSRYDHLPKDRKKFLKALFIVQKYPPSIAIYFFAIIVMTPAGITSDRGLHFVLLMSCFMKDVLMAAELMLHWYEKEHGDQS